MPISRYADNTVVSTSDSSYSDLLTKRGVTSIIHYSFKEFKKLKIKDVIGISVASHTWQFNDRFFKLSAEYYNDPTYWWIIAYYNSTPLESDVNVGDVIQIPLPLENILEALEY
tara:strand:- start:4298 stop:4639 length:342 start_codon:yes stop_codon:yes gene_type:complete